MKNKILGLDIGSKNTGIAISDSTKTIAFSYTTVLTNNLKESLIEIIEKEKINLIIVGKNLYQSKNFQVENYVTEHLPDNIQIKYINEDFSTIKAKDLAEQKGLSENEFKIKKDEISAQVILQDFLDGNY